MKMFNYFLVILAIVAVVRSDSELAAGQNEDHCRACQKVVYQLKFDRIADCGTLPCKNTCHKIVTAWNAPNSIYADFQNDVLGKCDICFRAGFCSLTECDQIRGEETRIVNELVENGHYRGILDADSGKLYVVGKKDNNLPPSSVSELEKEVKRSLKNSIRAGNAKLAADSVGNVVNNYVLQQAKSKQNDAIEKRNVIYKNFVHQANVIAEAIEKEVNVLKSLLDDYAKMRDFKTVSPVPNKKKNKSERDQARKRMSNLLNHVRQSIHKNQAMVIDTIRNLERTLKKATNERQTILKRNQKNLSNAEKRHLEKLETEITTMTNFIKPLGDVRDNFSGKLSLLKSFAFKLKQ